MAAAPASERQPLVLVSACKGERKTLRSGLKQLARHLRSAHCEVAKLDARPGLAAHGSISGAAVLVLGCPTQPLSPPELEALRSYVLGGGSLLVLGGEGGDPAAGSNLNILLGEFGMALRSDCVVQTAYSRYAHPKEVLVSDGTLSPDMESYCQSSSSSSSGRRGGGGGGLAAARDENGGAGVQLAYPNGATLAVRAPAVAFLSSGQTAHPYNAAIGAAWWGEGAGRLAVLGSCTMLDDEWLGRESNTAALDFMLGWLLRDPACALSAKTMRETELLPQLGSGGGGGGGESGTIPGSGGCGSSGLQGAGAPAVSHVAALAAQPRVALQQHPPLPRDPGALLADALFGFDLALVPQVAAARRRLLGGSSSSSSSDRSSGGGGGSAPLPPRGGQLPLWRPPLEVPFPALEPAVFPPPFPEPPPPPLELFDLDEEFAGPLEQLARITARYLAAAGAAAGSKGGDAGGRGSVCSGGSAPSAQQLDAYVAECGQLLGLRACQSNAGGRGAGREGSPGGGDSGGGKERGAARAMLSEALAAVVQCKMPGSYCA